MVVVGVAITAGAFGLLTVLRHTLREGVEQLDLAQLSSLRAVLSAGPPPQALPAGQGDMFSQVVANGRVVASSPSIVLGRAPIASGHPGEEGMVVDHLPVVLADDADRAAREGPWLVLSSRVQLVGAGEATIYVAGSMRSVVLVGQTAGRALAIGLPVLVLLVGILVWSFTGRALRPVEQVRDEVADITLRDLHRRVPVPSTGDEVAALATTMNEMLDRLESSAAAQRRFVADASHELRSPLAAVQANLEVVVAHPDAAGSPEAVADALAEAQRLHELVEDLLVLARAEEGGKVRPQRRELVDIDELVLAEVGRAAVLPGPSIDSSRVSGGRVRGDAAQLGRVVRNLLDNARRHASSVVTVEVTVEVTVGNEVLLAVADDGPGIPEDQRLRIFERFSRADEARSVDAGGTGLGLAIVREIVVSHGGTVEAVGNGIRGARFEVRLPSADEEG